MTDPDVTAQVWRGFVGVHLSVVPITREIALLDTFALAILVR